MNRARLDASERLVLDLAHAALVADAPAAPLPVVARALAAVRRERHREARRRAAKAHASPRKGGR